MMLLRAHLDAVASASLAKPRRLPAHIDDPRAFERPLQPAAAWERVCDWLAAPAAWIPLPGVHHPRLLGEIAVRYDARGSLLPDAMLAAPALEHGLTVCTTDTDFGRLAAVRWTNPSAEPS